MSKHLLATSLAGSALTAILAVSYASAQGLPPVPVPPQNPITEPKRVLGKILFWEEQLSSDNTVACGTCHRHENGSADPRVGPHPGADGIFGNADDIFGSPGVRRQDASGAFIPDPVFGLDTQVTGRTAQGFVGNQWSQLLFWDGRASSQFLDPETGAVVIPNGGALESQAVGPILSDVEMAHENRSWTEVTEKLETAAPMGLATDLPADMAAVLVDNPSYGDLFEAAFGTPDITGARIGMAIATYERTVIPNQTPWDLFTMTQQQQRGFQEFQRHQCGVCHSPPFFTDHSFRNIGLRDPDDDGGRFGITGNPQDRGRFKTPSLRNVGLRDRLMHTGHITDVADAIAFYRRIGHPHFPDNQDPLVRGGINMSPQDANDIREFVENGLTDPRAAAAEFPFDRPALFSESPTDAPVVLPEAIALTSAPNPFQSNTTIRYSSAVAGPVEFAVYDARGALVRRMVETGNQSGEGRFEWDGRSTDGRRVPGGVYFARVTTPEGAASIRVVRAE